MASKKWRGDKKHNAFSRKSQVEQDGSGKTNQDTSEGREKTPTLSAGPAIAWGGKSQSARDSLEKPRTWGSGRTEKFYQLKEHNLPFSISKG